MVTKIMEWVSITALLLAVTWRPFASYQLRVDFVVCGGALVGVLALFFIKREIETHYDVDDGSNPDRGESLQNCARGGPERYCKRRRDANARHNQYGNQAERGRRSFAGIRAIRKRTLDLFLHGW